MANLCFLLAAVLYGINFSLLIMRCTAEAEVEGVIKESSVENSIRYNVDNAETKNTTVSDVDWSQQVVVLHNRPEFRLKMGDTYTLLIAVSVLCERPDSKFKIGISTINTEIGYLAKTQRRDFSISCDDISQYSITKPLRNESAGYSSVSFALPTSPDETAERIVSEWLSSSLFQSKSDEYFDAWPEDIQKEWAARARSAAELFIEGGRASPNLRVAQVVNITVEADLLGRTRLQFHSFPLQTIHPLHRQNGSDVPDQEGKGHLVHEIPVVVLRNMRPIDFIFRVTLFILVGFSAVGMGCKTDLHIVKEVLKKPVAPFMGFIAQYICMPVIAFTVSQLMPLDNPAVRLGIFTCGVCPGGGASNIFTFLLHGDVSLSVTMTCISSVLAMAMIPLWMFTLGQRFNDPENNINVQVPFTRILQTVSLVVAPLFLGFLFNVKFPKLALKLKRLITPVAAVTVVFILTVGLYSNWYMIRMFRGGTVLAACLLPYAGYLVGAGLALASCQPLKRVKTVAIETGIQNTTVAYLMLTFSLPAPDADMAAVGSASSAFMTPLPLLVLSIVYRVWLIRKKKKNKKFNDNLEEQGENEDDNDDDEKLHDDGKPTEDVEMIKKADHVRNKNRIYKAEEGAKKIDSDISAQAPNKNSKSTEHEALKKNNTVTKDVNRNGEFVTDEEVKMISNSEK